MVGRKPKVIPNGSSELRITIPNEHIAFLEAVASLNNMPIGRLIRRAVEAYALRLEQVEQVEGDKAGMVEMMEEIRAKLRIIGSYIAAEEREQSNVADDVEF